MLTFQKKNRVFLYFFIFIIVIIVIFISMLIRGE